MEPRVASMTGLRRYDHGRRAAFVGLALLAVLCACARAETSTGPPAPPPPSVVISPHALVVAANSTYSFDVEIFPAEARSQLHCVVAPTGVGIVSVSAKGCTLQTATSVLGGGTLTAIVGTKSDTALLVVFATGQAAR